MNWDQKLLKMALPSKIYMASVENHSYMYVERVQSF